MTSKRTRRPLRIRPRSSARDSVMDADNARDINGAIRRALRRSCNRGVARVRVLVVGDAAAGSQAIARTLVEEGYDVESVADGKQAIDWLDAGSADVVVTAIPLPEASALIVLAASRAHGPKFVVLADASELESDRDEAKSRGAERLLVKPVEPAELLAGVREAIGKRG